MKTYGVNSVKRRYIEQQLSCTDPHMNHNYVLNILKLSTSTDSNVNDCVRPSENKVFHHK